MRCMVVALCIMMHAGTFTVKDNDDAEDVILVHYYPDEVDDEFDEGDVVEFVRVHFDGNAHLYEE
jgi:hypothetical protein